MHPPFLTRRHAVPGGPGESSREGRDCELSHRLTVLVLFPRFTRPGPWLLFLAGVCSFVAVRALELARF
jgi:hypothetical protein